ncbi:Motility protein B [compost metagenome]
MKNKRKEHHEEHIDETWLIPYADLLTLLLALFIILFASTQVDQKKYDQIMQSLNSAFSGGSAMFQQSNMVPLQPAPFSEKNQGEQKKEDEKNPTDSQLQQNQSLSKEQQEKYEEEMQDLKELKQKLDTYIKDNGLSTQLETKLTEDMLKITIRDNALFKSGSANIEADAQVLATSISNMLGEYSNYNVEVAGYTDNRPINNKEFDSNWDLSAKRSLNFMKILMQSKKIDPSHFRSIGYGEFQPIDTNDTEEGRAKNRRVEVNIIRILTSKQPQTITP